MYHSPPVPRWKTYDREDSYVKETRTRRRRSQSFQVNVDPNLGMRDQFLLRRRRRGPRLVFGGANQSFSANIETSIFTQEVT